MQDIEEASIVCQWRQGLTAERIATQPEWKIPDLVRVGTSQVWQFLKEIVAKVYMLVWGGQVRSSSSVNSQVSRLGICNRQSCFAERGLLHGRKIYSLLTRARALGLESTNGTAAHTVGRECIYISLSSNLKRSETIQPGKSPSCFGSSFGYLQESHQRVPVWEVCWVQVGLHLSSLLASWSSLSCLVSSELLHSKICSQIV